MQKEGIKETEDFIKGKMWNICSNLFFDKKASYSVRRIRI